MKKVFVLIENDFSLGITILGIYSTRERAEKAKEQHLSVCPDSDVDIIPEIVY